MSVTIVCPQTGYWYDTNANNGGGSCSECPVNYYCPGNDLKYQCPTSSTSTTKVSQISDCVCASGYFLENLKKCTICPVNSYCATNKVTACPTYATTNGATGKSVLSDCICAAGRYLTGNVCDICPADAYCPSNAIIYCPANSRSAIQQSSNNCTCAAGYYMNNNVCTICPADSYCTGNNQLSACPGGSTTRSGTGKTGIISCLCPEGQYFNSTNQCITCDANYYCSQGVKTACPATTTSDAGISDPTRCNCADGYYLTGISNQAGGTVCSQCPTNNYCTKNTVTSCPDFSTAPVISSLVTECICTAGKWLNIPSTGSATCDNCPSGSYCTGNNQKTACQQTNQITEIASSDVVNCKCPAGYYSSTGTYTGACNTCEADYFCPGGYARTACPAGKSTNSGTQKTKISDCFCPKGKYWNGTACTNCDVNTYCPGDDKQYYCPKDASSAGATDYCICPNGTYWVWPDTDNTNSSNNGACKICPANSYCTLNLSAKTIPVACPANSSSGQGAGVITECLCPPGTYLDQSQSTPACTACTAGYYCPGNNSRSQCLYGKTSSASSTMLGNCKCSPGQYFVPSADNLSGACTTCPANKYCPGNDMSYTCPSTTTTSTGQSACSCGAGSFFTGSTCQTCPAGYYCDGVSATVCPSTYTSSTGASTVADCKCPAGTYMVNNVCTACPAGSYCNGDNLSHLCPGIYGNSTAGSTFCVCIAGWFWQDGGCTSCFADYYCPGNNAKIKCPTNYSSKTYSTKFSDCTAPTPNIIQQTVTVETTFTESLSAGQIAGIALGLFGFLVVIIIAIVMLIKNGKKIAEENKRALYQSNTNSPNLNQSSTYNINNQSGVHLNTFGNQQNRTTL